MSWSSAMEYMQILSAQIHCPWALQYEQLHTDSLWACTCHLCLQPDPWQISDISAWQYWLLVKCCASDTLCVVVSADGCSLPSRAFAESFCRYKWTSLFSVHCVSLTVWISDICFEGCADLQSWMIVEVLTQNCASMQRCVGCATHNQILDLIFTVMVSRTAAFETCW